MKKNLLLFVLLFLFYFPITLFAQVEIPDGFRLCGFDEMSDVYKKNGNTHQQLMDAQEKLIQLAIKNNAYKKYLNAQGDAVFSIPVVVHIIHTGGAVGTTYNPSDAQVLQTIDYLNKIYDGSYPGIEGAGNIQIQFVLAKRTPDCAATNGIDRVDGSTRLANYSLNGVNFSRTTGVSESDLKDLCRWNSTNYLNIYCVNKIDGTDGTDGSAYVAGWSTFPGTDARLDGIVMLTRLLNSGQITLPHEVGHFFNLYHTFQGSSSTSNCPQNDDCSANGDRICDTDPITYNVTNGVFDFECRSGINGCTNTPYNKNTEHNIMSYTNCPKLFTSAQKSRMLAALTLDSRKTLLTSNALKATNVEPVCQANVFFDPIVGDVTQSTTSTSGCQGYTDYSYSVKIASAPNVDTYITLTTSGSAQNNIDYILSTNGNFTSPSNVVLFRQGETSDKAFQIRVFNRDAIRSPVTLNLSLTLASGSNVGSVAGREQFNFTIRNNNALPIPPSTNLNYQIGNYNINIYNESPFRSNKLKNRMQAIFLASELKTAGMTKGNIYGLILNIVTKNSTKAFKNLTISMAQTTETNLTNGYTSAGLTQVYKGSYTTTSGNNQFDFSTPFNWDGTSNIVLQFCFDNAPGSSDSYEDRITGTTAPLGQGNRATVYSNYSTQTDDACNLSPNYVSDNRMKIVFIAIGKGNSVATLANTSKTTYFGPNDDIYVYSTAGDILAHIKNTSNFDFGCTTISIDRAGTSSSTFWKTAKTSDLCSKTLSISPTNNSANASFILETFYTNDELQGWYTATGNTLSQANMVLINNGYAISDVTPQNNRFSDVAIIQPVHSTYGNQNKFSATFTNTLLPSGVGLGAPQALTLIPDVAASPVNSSVCDGNNTNIILSNPNAVNGTLYKWAVTSFSNVNGASDQTTSSTGPIAQTLTLVDNTQKGIVIYSITPIATPNVGSNIYVTVNVNPKPIISQQPLSGLQSSTFCSGASVNLAVTASGNNLKYQWTKNSAFVVGQTNSSYTYNALANGTVDGKYQVSVTNSDGCFVKSNFVNISTTSINASVVANSYTAVVGDKIDFYIYPTTSIVSQTYYFGDGEQNSLSTPDHGYSFEGSYVVTAVVTLSNSCVQPIYSSPISIRSQISPSYNLNKIGLSPVPVTNVLHVVSDKEMKSLQIANMNGVILTVFPDLQNAKQVDIQVSSYSQGIFIIAVEDKDGKVYYSKFFKG